MSVPVAYSDIGKPVKDLLSKDFPTGSVNLEVKTTASNGVQFIVSGAKDNKSGLIGAELKSKYADRKSGLVLTESWTTANQVGLSAELTDTLVKGLKLDLSGSLAAASGAKTAKFGMEYKQEYLFTRASLDLLKGPTLSGDTVVGADGFLVGGDVAYDVADAKITRHNAALGYTASDYAVALHASNAFNTLSASYFHRVAPEIEAGAKALWDRKAGPSGVGIELGCKYVLDRDTFVKTKIDNTGRVGLGYTQVLRPGVKLALGGSFDTSRLNENVHKVGFALTLEA